MPVRRPPGHGTYRLALAGCLVLGAACSHSAVEKSGVAGAAGTAGPAGTGGRAAAGTAGARASGGGSSVGASGGLGITGGSGGLGVGGAGAAGANGPGGGGGGTAGAGGGGEATPGGCGARAGLLFCDDFEARTGLTGPWTPQINGSGTVTVDTEMGHSGARSVHVHAGDNDFDTLFALHDPTILPTPSGRFYVRTYIRLGRAMSAEHNSYIIAEATSSPGSSNNLRLGEMNEMLMYTIAGDSHGALSNQNYYSDHKPGVAFPPSAWVCLEVLLDPAKPEIDVWVGGVEAPDLHHTDWPLDRYDTVRFGFEKYGGPGLDLWYDDVAVGTARIGCN